MRTSSLTSSYYDVAPTISVEVTARYMDAASEGGRKGKEAVKNNVSSLFEVSSFERDDVWTAARSSCRDELIDIVAIEIASSDLNSAPERLIIGQETRERTCEGCVIKPSDYMRSATGAGSGNNGWLFSLSNAC
jgi:hypothetical protein